MSEASLLARAEHELGNAALLLDAGACEAAVSRAYYAMFYAAEALLLRDGHAASTHKGVIALLGRHFVEPERLSVETGRLLARVADQRYQADYADDFVFSTEEAGAVLEDARTFVTELYRLLLD